MSKPPKEPRSTEPSAPLQTDAPEPQAPAPEQQPTDPAQPQGEPTALAPLDAPARAPGPTPEHTAPGDTAAGDHQRGDQPQRRGPAPAPVVGVVCSAGGLKALEELFGAVPPDSGLAWIVMPHLALDQPSMLVELLAKHTPVPVHPAEDNAVPRADIVYVARPAQGLTLRGGHMRIEPLKHPTQAEAALDALLTSLAEDLGPAALGVILSGSGDAGLDGLRSIVDAGGLGVVQLPATAQFGAMPQAAIDAGLVDMALPPAEIPAALLEHVRPGGELLLLKDFSEDTAEQSALRSILALLRVRTRYDFRDYRPSMVSRRIRRRIDQLGPADTRAYLKTLRDTPAELERLYRELMIGVTGFFRDEEAFAALRRDVIEPLVQRHHGEQPLRVWVPGCTAGQEAYSIAMLLLEAFSAGGRAANVQVFATDIDAAALEQARHGIYTEAAMKGLGRARRERFFTTLGGGRQQVGKALREVVVFAAQNLLRDPPFSRIDLISCRNVLIYLKPEAQEQVIARFHFALNPGGYLFLGTAESVGSNKDLFETLSKRWRIFRRTGPSRQDLNSLAMPLSEPLRELSAASPFADFEQRTDFKETARRTLCELFAPAAVLINAGYDILYYNGPTAKYLEQPSGEPTRNLLELLRRGLLAPVRGACQTALREERPVRVGDAVALRDAEQVPVEVLAHPVRESRLAERLLLVTFRDLGEPAAADTQPVAAEPEGAELSTVEQLEFELRATRDDLRSTIEELQSANEQLRAANEEVISTNEEMQSTNEELQTSKEELQSLNEELSTVNSQMQEKVTELEERNSDINNLLASSNAATVFLDRGLRVKLFTPAAKDLMNLRPTDVDRPLEELSFRIDDQALLADCAGVLDTLAPIERRVSGDGSRFLRRVQPYRSNDDRIDGVVITFTDVTASSAAEARLAASERHYRHLFEASPIPMLQQDWSAVAPLLAQWGTAAHDPAFFRAHPDHGAACRTAIRLQAVNAAARRLLGLPDDLPLPQPLPGNCCPDELDKILAALAAGERVASAEAQVQRPGGPPHPMLCQLALMPGSEAAMDQMLVLMLDIHEQKVLERELQTSEQRLRRALRVVHEAVWEHDLLHRRLWWSDEYERQFGRPTPSQPPARDWWLDGIHPADRDAAQAQVRQAIDAHADEWQAQYRMRRPDGRTLHVLARGALTWNADGALTSMLGCMLDVSDLKTAQDALAERETRLRSVLEAAAEAIITTDADGRIQTFNPAAEAMFRCTADGVTGKPVRGLFARGDGTPPDPLVEQPDHQPRQLEGRRAQGEPFPLELSARFVPEQQLWVLVGRDVSERRRLERDVIDLSTRQQEEVGREIHDGLGQELTALVMLAHSLRRQLEDQPAAASADAFVQLEDYLRHALETCRSIARGLSAEVSAPGLENALAEVTAGMERAAGIPCRFSHTGTCAGIGEQQAAHLYRIAQEAISNAMRHAMAKRVDVSLEVGDTEVVLRIRDDGQGIPPGAKRGLGLRLMAYRAGMLGGTCEVAPVDGGGTLVECRVPRQR